MSVGGRHGRVPFTDAGTRGLIWAYTVTIGLLAVWNLDEVRNPAPTLFGLLVLVGAAILFTVDQGSPIGLATSLVIAASWVIVAILVSWQLEVAGGHSQWFLGAGTVSMFFVSLRGRVVVGWLGFVALAAVVVVWGATTDTGVVTALLLVGKQAPILLVGALFAIGMRRTAATIRRLNEETNARATAEAAQLATSAERMRRLAELDAVATPLLDRLVAGVELTASDRVEFAVAEAELRDGVRARSLAVPEIVEAARGARRRGVEVVLLDDLYPEHPDPATLGAVVTRLADALNVAKNGRLVARLLPAGREDAATILIDGANAQRHEVIPR